MACSGLSGALLVYAALCVFAIEDPRPAPPPLAGSCAGDEASLFQSQITRHRDGSTIKHFSKGRRFGDVAKEKSRNTVNTTSAVNTTPTDWNADATDQSFAPDLSSLRARLTSWLPRANATKELARMSFNPRHRSAIALNLIGFGSKASLHGLGHLNHASDYVGPVVCIAVIVPLGVLATACFIAEASPRAFHDQSAGSPLHHSHSKPDLRARPPSPRLAAYSTRGSCGSVSARPTIGGAPGGSNYGQAQVYQMSRGGSLMPSARPSYTTTPRAVGAAGLCPELAVPEGNECILGVPSLTGSASGEVMLQTITDKSGQRLLFVGVTTSPAGGEYVLLAKKDQQELAYCETGSAVRAEGWAGKIFRWDGELYARMREATGEDDRRSTVGYPGASPQRIAGRNKTYVILSAVGLPWELRITGDFKERMLTVEDGSRQVVAMVSPGKDLSFSPAAGGDFYRLRLGPRADSCTVIVALIAIERLLSQQGELS